MSFQTGRDPGVCQFLSRIDTLLKQLDHSWTNLGLLKDSSGQLSEEGSTFSKLLPTLQALDSLVQKENHQHKVLEVHIEDQLEKIEQLCAVLGRPLDQYIEIPFIKPTIYSFEASRQLDKIISELEEAIEARRKKIGQVQGYIATLTEQLQIPLREFDYDVFTTDVSAVSLEPILHYHDQLSTQYKLYIDIFNTTISRIYFKWSSLSMEPETKDELDLQLGELFETTPATISNPLSIPGVPNFSHDISIYSWFSPKLKLCMKPLSYDTLQILLDKAQLDQTTAMPLLSRNDLLTQLRYFYDLADWDTELLSEKIGDVILASLKKIKEHRDEIDTHIDDNVMPLTELHSKRLTGLWELCHVAQDTKENFHTQVEELGTPRERLETIYDEYALLKFQFDNAPDIFSKIRHRKFIIDKLREFEAKHSSKDRFKGSSLALLQEEKFRKKEYPALCQLENVLLEMVIEYESRIGKTFKYEGGKFRLILEKSIERRFGNLEIIGLKDSMSTESFSRPRLIPGKETNKSKESEVPRSPSVASSRTTSRSASRSTSRATSRAASRTGTLTTPGNSTHSSPNIGVPRTPPQPLRSPIPRSVSGTVSPSNNHKSPLMSPTPRHTRPPLNSAKSSPSIPLSPPSRPLSKISSSTKPSRHISSKSTSASIPSLPSNSPKAK